MQELKEVVERTEDGAFIVKLTSEDGSLLAEGEGETYELALEEAQSKL
jgi:predicted RNase H-like HicB family nuclease